MKRYADMTADQRREEYAAVRKAYEAQKALGLKLNMARGKPSTEQLDMVTREMAQLTRPEDYLAGGLDTRNYGELAGIPEARALFAEILGCRAEQVFVGGNASLQLMYDAISKAYTHGMLHSEKPWGKLETVKWLCPAPGYDRHFRICQSFGMELITVPMTEEGPDMDMVERLVRDPAVKGMWNVPKYSNPQGIIYSAETVQRLAAMRPAAPDFMLMWDNAYCIHELEGEFVPFPDILSLCRQAGNGDMVYEFASTSKITFPGAGVAVMACSEANMAHMLSLIGVQTIGYDKINQLRHVRYLKDRSHTLALMQRHAAVLAPKFRAVLTALEQLVPLDIAQWTRPTGGYFISLDAMPGTARRALEQLVPLDIAQWTRPTGGYFISLDAMPGTARRALELCREAGVTMTGAGATYPYGVDPADSNIRIAPSLPPVAELEQAAQVLCTCLRLAALEKLGV